MQLAEHLVVRQNLRWPYILYVASEYNHVSLLCHDAVHHPLNHPFPSLSVTAQMQVREVNDTVAVKGFRQVSRLIDDLTYPEILKSKRQSIAEERYRHTGTSRSHLSSPSLGQQPSTEEEYQ